jgi:hypothetical protein
VVKNISPRLVICISFVCVAYFVISLINRPIISNDAIHSYVSLHNYLNGSSWNKLWQFNQNASKLNAGFITWWAPGPYEIPYLTAKLLHCDIGLAICLLSFISILLGSFFYYKIFEGSSLPKNIVLIAVLILLLERFINMNFNQYTSSDLFLFFYIPFYIFCYQKANETSKYYWLNLFALLLLNITGLFIKNSFLLFSTAFNIYLIVDFIFEQLRLKKPLFGIYMIRKVTILTPFLLSVILFYWFFLRLGFNPTSGQGFLISISSIISGLFSGIVGVLFGSLSVSGVYGNLQDKLAFLSSYAILIMLAVLLIIFYLIYQYRKSIKSMFQTDSIFRVTLVIGVMYVVYWLIFALKRSYISNEDRLFLPITIFVLSYFIDYAFKANKFIKYIAYTAISLSVIYGVGTMYYRVKNYSSDRMSANVTDNKLKGFRVFIHQSNDVAQMDSISKYIISNHQAEKIITTNPDGLFLLAVNNQYILVDDLAIPAAVKDHNKYLLLVSDKTIVSTTGWHSIYATGGYNLYLSN